MVYCKDVELRGTRPIGPGDGPWRASEPTSGRCAICSFVPFAMDVRLHLECHVPPALYAPRKSS